MSKGQTKISRVHEHKSWKNNLQTPGKVTVDKFAQLQIVLETAEEKPS